MEKVDKRRESIYRYIVKRLGTGYSPSVREICEDMAIASTSTVHSDLHHLVDLGLIEMDEGRNRTIRLPGSAGALVPLLISATAEQPLLAARNIEQYIPVAMLDPGKDLFALRVRDDSMRDVAILEGDIVVVEQAAVESGEIAAAMLNGEATVRRFYFDGGAVRLQPENAAYPTAVSDGAELLGRVLCVMRFL